jgi:chorismate mutase
VDVPENTVAAVEAATIELLEAICAANPALDSADAGAVWFTATPDLNAQFPAIAARKLGWMEVALMCAQEIAVPGSLPRVVRVLVLWNTERAQDEVRHVYLGAASALRPDIPQTQAANPLNGHGD